MSCTNLSRQRVFPMLLGLLVTVVACVPAASSLHAPGEPDDFRWMRGANYVASYAATSVEMWLHYDHAIIDRELGYARQMGLNCVRVFLQSLVYDHDPQAFLARISRTSWPRRTNMG